MSNQLYKKYGIFLFAQPPWEDSNERAFLAPTKWITFSAVEESPEHKGSLRVRVDWPDSDFGSNYLRMHRENQNSDELVQLVATLLYSSDGET